MQDVNLERDSDSDEEKPPVSSLGDAGDGPDTELIERDVRQPFPLPVHRVIPSHPSPTERYFDVRFHIPVLSDHAREFRKVGDQVVLIHTNRICLISLSHRHPVLDQNDEGKEIESVSFESESGFNNRLDNKVSGRKKHGAQKLKVKSVLCRIQCRDGSVFHVLTGMKGKLIEVNENLIQDPSLLRKDPYGRGYVAIVMSTIQRVNSLRETLLSPEAYESLNREKVTSDEPDAKKMKTEAIE